MAVAQCKPHYLFLFTPKAKPHMMHKSPQITRDTVPLKIAIFIIQEGTTFGLCRQAIAAFLNIRDNLFNVITRPTVCTIRNIV